MGLSRSVKELLYLYLFSDLSCVTGYLTKKHLVQFLKVRDLGKLEIIRVVILQSIGRSLNSPPPPRPNYIFSPKTA
jgi:hypothetical protein